MEDAPAHREHHAPPAKRIKAVERTISDKAAKIGGSSPPGNLAESWPVKYGGDKMVLLWNLLWGTFCKVAIGTVLPNSVQAVTQFGGKALFGTWGLQSRPSWQYLDLRQLRVGEARSISLDWGTNTKSIPANRKDFRPSQYGQLLGYSMPLEMLPRLIDKEPSFGAFLRPMDYL